MLEAGVPFSVVASIMGWSASTTVRMAKSYGHIGDRAQRLAVDAFCEPVSDGGVAQNRAQSKNVAVGTRANLLKNLAPRARFELGTLRLTVAAHVFPTEYDDLLLC
jgi:hypothetical protein